MGRFVFTESSWVIDFQQKMSNSKKRKCKESQRRWMKEDIDKFSEILADPANNYGASLEKLALKKLLNNELFEHIKNTFDEELNGREFKLMNIKKTSQKMAILYRTKLWIHRLKD